MTAPSPFSPNIPNFQTTWDSTSLGWFKECPRKYQYQMLEQWTTRKRGLHLAFGGWYASGVERYAHYRARGDSHDTAVLAVVKWVLAETMVDAANPECGMCGGDGLSRFECDAPDTPCPCVRRAPWHSGDEYKNRYTLVRSLVWNLDDQDASSWRTVILANGSPAVELTFKFPAFVLDGEQIFLSGHMDKLVENSGQVWVMDDKTTKSALTANYAQQWSPNNQMSLYSLAAKIFFHTPVVGVLVRAAQIGVGFTRFATFQAPRPSAVLEEWLDETRVYIESARSYAIANFWPRNDKSCGNFGGCPFQKVCSVSPSHRASWLRTDFVKREWNPLEARGDIG